MKLEAVTAHVSNGAETFPPKDVSLCVHPMAKLHNYCYIQCLIAHTALWLPYFASRSLICNQAFYDARLLCLCTTKYILAESFTFIAFFCLQYGAPTYNTAPGLTFDPQTPREYAQGSPASEWLHMQIGGTYERVTWPEQNFRVAPDEAYHESTANRPLLF
jgi:hypothetical protein